MPGLMSDEGLPGAGLMHSCRAATVWAWLQPWLMAALAFPFRDLHETWRLDAAMRRVLKVLEVQFEDATREDSWPVVAWRLSMMAASLPFIGILLALHAVAKVRLQMAVLV